MNSGTALLITRFGDLCREMGMTPAQALVAFSALPYGARQAAWDDLARYTVSTRGSSS